MRYARAFSGERLPRPRRRRAQVLAAAVALLLAAAVLAATLPAVAR